MWWSALTSKALLSQALTLTLSHPNEPPSETFTTYIFKLELFCIEVVGICPLLENLKNSIENGTDFETVHDECRAAL